MTTVTQDERGTKRRFLDGKLHCADGPAVEYTDGTKVWCLHGKLHRTDGPAIEYTDGIKKWYRDGELHRANGPAVEWSGSGYKAWYLNDRELTEAEFNKICSRS